MMSGLIVFILCALLLVLGYVFYGRLAERIYGVDCQKEMPCYARRDGVDFTPMPVWKIFLIQLLNIAGLGPVFGALAGCLFGPVALVWIVVGCIVAGAMHDFLAALMSAEHDGENLPEVVGRHLGGVARHAMRVICVALLLLVGVVFTKGPAGMLHGLFSQISLTTWCVLIMLYYFLATILPINTIIGKLYPVFGLLFIGMAVSLAVALPTSGLDLIPNLDGGTNQHPESLPVWPMIFVTIACGAISGFHATQSPMMVRCLPDIRKARRVFYGAMIAEGLVALVWAVIGLTLCDQVTAYAMGSDANGAEMLPHLAAQGESCIDFARLSLANPALAVNEACTSLLGPAGALLAVLGVVVLPITSGDTALRSCRLMLADAMHLDQRSVGRRLALALPVFALVVFISQVDFSVIWRYFGWSNQVLSCFTLWSITVCLRRRGRWFWLSAVPALFMTTMCTTYLFEASECGIVLSQTFSTGIGLAVGAVCMALLFLRCRAQGDTVASHLGD